MGRIDIPIIDRNQAMVKKFSKFIQACRPNASADLGVEIIMLPDEKYQWQVSENPAFKKWSKSDIVPFEWHHAEFSNVMQRSCLI